jgi:hypothetical protein
VNGVLIDNKNYSFSVGKVYCKYNTSEVKYYIFSVCVIESNL